MWRKEPTYDELTPEQRNFRRTMKKLKFYADEDIEELAVEHLRNRKVSIISARELGFRGYDDGFQAKYAHEQKLCLLTKNGKDFLDNHKLPFMNMHGVMVIEESGGSERFYTALNHIVDSLLPFGGFFYFAKTRVSASSVIVKHYWQGQYTTYRFTLDNGFWYRWVE